MTLSAWRPARLSRAQQEERRLAAQPLLNDPDWSTRDLARHFGVAEVTVRAWRARIRHGGEEALRASRATGRPEFLTPADDDGRQGLAVLLDGGSPESQELRCRSHRAHHNVPDQ
ncbi:helix-turn-helix domain-containing protein [Deinococcus sp. SL84]|nr:helix-turn-helix domain-containing protein [Deinococcus sp. SL84]MCY1704328.1 helix-turn-helix domain-containing protein [Deinococcus sp. SL84]